MALIETQPTRRKKNINYLMVLAILGIIVFLGFLATLLFKPVSLEAVENSKSYSYQDFKANLTGNDK